MMKNEDLRLLSLPAIFLGADAALDSWLLFQAPIELYVFSRALAVPTGLAIILLLSRLDLDGYSMPESGIIWTSLALSISTLLVGFRQEWLQSPTYIGAGITSSLVTAINFLSLQYTCQQLSRSYHQLSGDDDGENLPSQDGILSLKVASKIKQLKHPSLVAAFTLLPNLIFSGELGLLARNCYILEVFGLQISLFLSIFFCCLLFSSMTLLVQETSAHAALFCSVLMTAAILPRFESWKLVLSPTVGLLGCFVAAEIFLYICYRRSSLKAVVDDSHLGQRLRGVKISYRGGAFFFVGFVCSIILWLGWTTRGAAPAASLLPLAKSKTGYLGMRPNPNTHANFSKLLTGCRGENKQFTLDFAHCLHYLASKQEDYFYLSENNHSGASSGSREDQIQHSTIDDNSNPELNEAGSLCEGQVIPYHIWWTGPPNSRMELFIKSYFFTQNLPCSVLYIWVNTDQGPQHALAAWTSNEIFQQLFRPLLSFGQMVLKPWSLPSRVPLPPLEEQDPLDIARNHDFPGIPNAKGEVRIADSVIRDATGQLWLELYPPSRSHQIKYFTVAASDAARLIILHLYGGVYIDVDMVLLRDLRPLILPQLGFAERWGDHDFYNNAIVALPANSSISSYLLRGGMRSGLQFHFVALSRMMRKEKRDDGNQGGLVMFENGLFDPATAWFFGHEEKGGCTVPCVRHFGDVFKALPLYEEWSAFHEERIDGVPEGGNNRTVENSLRALGHIMFITSGVRRLKPGVGCMSFLQRMMRSLAAMKIIYMGKSGWEKPFQTYDFL